MVPLLQLRQCFSFMHFQITIYITKCCRHNTPHIPNTKNHQNGGPALIRDAFSLLSMGRPAAPTNHGAVAFYWFIWGAGCWAWPCCGWLSCLWQNRDRGGVKCAYRCLRWLLQQWNGSQRSRRGDLREEVWRDGAAGGGRGDKAMLNIIWSAEENEHDSIVALDSRPWE